MDRIEKKFEKLGVEHSPGQESLQGEDFCPWEIKKLEGDLVDFSHGDVDAHEPIPGSLQTFIEGFERGARQAYTEYRGAKVLRDDLAKKLERFTKTSVDSDRELIITSGTQGALFLAMGATVAEGDKVAIVEPDYFANRKLVEFFGGEKVGIPMDYLGAREENRAGIDLHQLEQAFACGVKVFLFSNPNNPTGVIYSDEELTAIAALAKKYQVFLIVDELYSRQIFDHRTYIHMRGKDIKREQILTIMGPSKTESLSGFRLGVAYGAEDVVKRMEKLQAIMCLRAPGYCQAVLANWFCEPEGWMERRICDHQQIRDQLVERFEKVEGLQIRVTEAGSYIFPKLPPLSLSLFDFVKILRLYANVIVTPGTEFGPQFTDSIRLNFSQDRKKALMAVDRICEMIERYRK